MKQKQIETHSQLHTPIKIIYIDHSIYAIEKSK